MIPRKSINGNSILPGRHEDIIATVEVGNGYGWFRLEYSQEGLRFFGSRDGDYIYPNLGLTNEAIDHWSCYMQPLFFEEAIVSGQKALRKIEKRIEAFPKEVEKKEKLLEKTKRKLDQAIKLEKKTDALEKQVELLTVFISNPEVVIKKLQASYARADKKLQKAKKNLVANRRNWELIKGQKHLRKITK